MFGIGKKAALREAAEGARAALASADLAAVAAAYEALWMARHEADPDDAETGALLEELGRHRSAVAARHLAGRARPCARCGGGEIAVSEPFRFTKIEVARSAPIEARMHSTSPELRLWACRACGAAELVVDDVAELDTPLFLAVLRAPPDERGPFR